MTFAVVSALPEIILAVLTMLFLLAGAYLRSLTPREIYQLVAIMLFITLILVLVGADGLAFNGLFIQDSYSRFLKVLILGASIATLLMTLHLSQQNNLNKVEYPILFACAILGMMAMVSANDLMSLYIGLELQSLSLYTLAAFRRDAPHASEAGLKYFVLGAIASGLFLYGSSMVYGYTGQTGFADIALAMSNLHGNQPEAGLVIGLSFVVAGLAFKMSAAPFHMWTPDVYQGAPTPVTAFFAAAPKIAAIGLFIRLIYGPFGNMYDSWGQLVMFMAIASMAVGAFGALTQTNIKRMMAYSSIGHVGFALVGLSTGTKDGLIATLIYMTVYVISIIGSFGCILAMRSGGRGDKSISSLAGLSRYNKPLALAFLFFMFSLAGIPPFAGFFAKFFVLQAAVQADLIGLSVVAVILSVVSAFYYLRIVKIVWFDETDEELDPVQDGWMRFFICICAVLTVLFFVGLPKVSGLAEVAGRTVFG